MFRLSLILITFLTIGFAQNSPHGSNLKLQCDDCHSEQSWNILSTEMKFNHDQTGFSLTGQHKMVNCRQCHSTLKFEEAKNDCKACHNDVHQNTFGIDCQRCHTSETWIVKNIRQIHNQTRFPLTGIHQNVNCQSYHQSINRLVFEEKSIECYSCHRKDFEQAKNPDHISANFSTNCLECHSFESKGWGGRNFTHAFFPLVGGHEIKNCYTCHNQQTFQGLDTKCVSCHLDNYQQTQNPNHQQVGFSTNCENCHKITSWKDAQFDHDNQFFPIYSGKHKGKWNTCADCHSNQNNYAEFSCINCHEHNKTTMDQKHRNVNGYVYNSQACYNCHPNGSEDGAFNHDMTNFPLTGAHTNLSCNSCHQNGFDNTPTECQACHIDDFNQTQNPNHQQIGLNTQCNNCHNTNAWTPSTFNHSNTNFPLTGAHTSTNCSNCHQGQTTGTSTQCLSCHQDDYNQTTNPNHSQLGFPTNCDQCHSTQAWQPASFDHNNTQFPLTGAHTNLSCNSCHQNGFNNTPTECQACHIDDFNQTQNPNHQQIGLNTQCNNCHNTNAWTPSTFNHSNTNFPLTGAHTSTNCSNCHQGQTTGTPTQCFSCHQNQFNQTTNPSHTALNLPTTCENCHTTNPNWKPALFPIHDNFYPLTGQHNSIRNNCNSCHNGNYNNTPNQCQGCHMNDFNGTTNPNHVSLQFPHQCDMCHTTNGWSPSTFNHDQQYFPIFSGKHKNKWANCSICHTNPSNFAVFSCITCHEHNKTTMDQKHRNVNGYVYNSQACYNCHPNGDNLMHIDNFRRN
ncbi:MAG: hypothetical protein HPY57_07945 [Ignavibacteria bacterium]|nr:hypothetical protein [Ignavibacteria bacterium]